MRYLGFVICVVSLTFMSCKSARSQATNEQIETLKNLVENRNFSLEFLWAYPQATGATQQVLNSKVLQAGSSAGAINLIGNSNFLTISGDTISSYLPYFGERRGSVAYSGKDSAIQLDGVLENFKVSEGKHHSYSLSFDARSKSEHFKVVIRLYPNLKSYLTVIGDSRTSISYSGQLIPKT